MWIENTNNLIRIVLLSKKLIIIRNMATLRCLLSDKGTAKVAPAGPERITAPHHSAERLLHSYNSRTSQQNTTGGGGDVEDVCFIPYTLLHCFQLNLIVNIKRLENIVDYSTVLWSVWDSTESSASLKHWDQTNEDETLLTTHSVCLCLCVCGL